MDLLATAPEAAALPIMRAEGLQALAEAHGAQLLRETIGTRVSPALALAVMAVESRGDAAARSHAGAQGLMQLIPATATQFGVEDAFDGGQNIAGGIAYLDWLMAEFDRDPILTLAAYNAGEGAVRAAGGVPPYPKRAIRAARSGDMGGGAPAVRDAAGTGLGWLRVPAMVAQ